METEDEFIADGQRRLFIKDMVMRNFKSYAGEQRVGPFDKSFSAVVGPNGSGKSNVIDAMLFVFGKRAKQMRLNKVSELIHNSTNHQNLDSAGVSVHFQEIVDLDDGTFKAVPGSDFVITRVAFRDNSSKYYINDRASSFTEVTKKLKGKGVDLDNNRFLILQGEVEQISLMKPKAQGSHDEGFLEYLEDIIGTNQCVERIDELYRELEFLNEKRSGVVQMVKLAEKERDGLEDVKNEAEAYMLKEMSVLKWQEKATRLSHEDTTAKMVDLQENMLIIEGNLMSEREKVQENISALKELESIHSKHMKTQEDLDTDLSGCKEEFKQFEREDVKYREDLKHVKQKIKKLKHKLEKDSLKINDLEKEGEDSRNLVAILEESFPQLQKLLLGEEKVLEEILEHSKVETESHRSELTKVRAELEPWDKQLIEHRGKLEVACTEQKLLNEKHESGRKSFEDAQKQMGDLLKKIETKTAGVENIRSELEKNTIESMKARNEKQEHIREEEALIPREQAARQKVLELKSALDSERSQGKVLKAILDAKKSNLIQGIHGRLGDFGSIDAKYDVAISTSCPRLDCIVVETTTVAKACFDLLRRENLGIASCLALEELPEIKYVSTPEGVPRLFDLVRIQDERMKPAFFQATGDTILANDVNQARRIAFKGFQVVTLNGELWTKVGTMTGGGPIPRGGKMGTSIRATSVSGEDVVNAENELTDMVDSLKNIRQQIADAEWRYQTSEKAVAPLGMELAKNQKEIESLNSQHNYLEKQIGSLEAVSQPKKDELDRLAELMHIISVEEKEIDKLIQGPKQLREKALELQSNIENAGGETLREQKFKVNKIQADIDNNNTETNRHRVQIETGQKTIKKLTKVIEESKNEKECLVKEKENFCAKFKEIEEKAFVVKEKYEGVQKLIDRHTYLLDKAKSDYNKMKKTVDELRALEVDAEFKLQDMRKLCKELELKEKGYKKRIDSLQTSLLKHMEQIQKDLVDPNKLQAALADEILNNPCDLTRSLEMVVLLEAQLKEMNPNLDSIAEYQGKVSLYNERVEDLNMVTQQRDEIKRQYDNWRKKRLDEFMAGFNAISLKLKEMYQMITLGGDAELELVDTLDPFSEGVVFSVRPPKKSWKNIANLSGGEKTLSSLALVFALHQYKPTPLYVMDEIDAALDFKNVSIVGNYVKDRTKDAQFIIISLRNNMFELADRLVGIYKTDNCTKSIAIDPGRFVVSGGIAA